MKAVKMPTQIRRPSARTLAPTAPDVNPNNLTLTIIAILIFVLHLAGAAMLGRSQALAIAPAEAGCSGEPTQKERSLPYD
jgi:hypothetical protein